MADFAQKTRRPENSSGALNQVVSRRSADAGHGGLMAAMNGSPRSQGLAQLKVALNQSPRMVAQLRAILQKQGVEDEEPMQGKFAAMQRQGVEDEELKQAKFSPVQRQGNGDEEMQMKAQAPANR